MGGALWRTPSRWPRWVQVTVGIGASVAFLWGLLAFVYGIVRGDICNPIDAACVGSTAKKLGDFVQLTWMSEYQTLFSSLVATAAAAITVWFIREQIALADRHEQERIAREHAAVRAVLPLALSALIEYAQSVAGHATHILKANPANRFPSAPIQDFPTPPIDAIDVFKQFIRTLEPAEAKYVAELLANVQVLRARTLSTFQNAPRTSYILSRSTFEDHIIDAAKIYHHAESIFEYARWESDQIPRNFTRKDVAGAVARLSFGEFASEALLQSPYFRKENLDRLVLGPRRRETE